MVFDKPHLTYLTVYSIRFLFFSFFLSERQEDRWNVTSCYGYFFLFSCGSVFDTQFSLLFFFLLFSSSSSWPSVWVCAYKREQWGGSAHKRGKRENKKKMKTCCNEPHRTNSWLECRPNRVHLSFCFFFSLAFF